MTRNLSILSYLILLFIPLVYPANHLPGTGVSRVEAVVGKMVDSSSQSRSLRAVPLIDPADDLIDIPEAPPTQGALPSAIKDLKAADPAEGITMIVAPTANSMGNAVLSFNMNLPEGRSGMQPSLGIQYNNEGGSSWMGNGWNLATPAIGIDTRWGVPRYDGGLETEIYTLNGEQMAPVNNHSALVARSTDKRFYPRVEGAFNKIIRHGNSPLNYWWEVTEKDGVRNFYGGRPGSGVDANGVLKDDLGNIAYWALVERRDPNDNFIRYVYASVDDPGLTGSSLPGRQLYLSQVLYTGSGSTDGAYTLEFVRDRTLGEPKRKDVTIDARLGFKMVSADLLRKVIIRYNGLIIRSYEFLYAEGAFYKTLLKNIKELDDAGALFYSQELEYFDDVNKLDYHPLTTITPWDIANDGIKGDIQNPIPSFTGEGSAISTVKATGGGAGVVVTIGTISGGVWSKKMSVGGGFNYGEDDQESLSSLIDINGDGLPDKVFKKDGKLFYRANMGVVSHRFGDLKSITGVTDFGTSNSKNIGGGGQALPFTGFLGFNHITSTTTSKVYFSDFNGDGLMDIASGGQVFFNHLNAQGDPEFALSSALTPSPIFTGSIDKSFLARDTALQSKQERDFPLEDVVRFWEAPAGGVVSITAPVQLQVVNSAGVVKKRKDGVRVSIQKGDSVMWNTTIDATDFSVKPANLSLSVTKGQRIYFRMQSRYNGEEDLVGWDPVIEYSSFVAPQSDVQHKVSSYYRASADFILHSKSIIGIAKDGTLAFDGSFRKDVTSDSVALQILLTRNNITTTVFERSYTPTELAAGNLPVPGLLSVLTGDELRFLVVSRSYIDRSALQWNPRYAYVAFTDNTPVTNANGAPMIQSAVVPDNSNFNNRVIAAVPTVVPLQDTVVLWPDVAGSGASGTLWFSVKGLDTVYARRRIFVNGGTMNTAMDSIFLIRKANERLFFEYATDTMDFALDLQAPLVKVYRDSAYLDSNLQLQHARKLDTTLPADLYANPAVEYLGALFRGWGGFAFKGDKGDGPIYESTINLNELNNYPTDPNNYTDTNAISGIQDPSKTDFTVLFPDAGKQSWKGYDTSVYIAGGYMSSSRLYLHDVYVDSLMAGESAGAADKVNTTVTESFSIGITIKGTGPSGGTSTAKSTINLDMMDLNGDRYPDVLNDTKVQYTLPNGGLGTTVIDQPVGSTISTGSAEGLSLGGDFVMANTGNSTKKGAVAAEKTAESSMGVSGSVNKNDDETGSSWIDINGDGLIDRVYGNGMVALNLGYRFAAAEQWDLAGIDRAESLSEGAGLGINLDGGSLEAGVGLSRTEGKNSYLLNDVNGDGLPDQLSMSGDDVLVRINTGNGWGPTLAWKGFDGIASVVSTGESINAAFTIPIPIYIILMKICINPAVNVCNGVSMQSKVLMDIDGDGYADLVNSNNDGQLSASVSSIGRTNMLSTVKGPIGGSYFTMDYARVGNTYEMPQSKWVLKGVTRYDGVSGDGVDTMRKEFSYAGGHLDRDEREFYGFATVTTRDLNTANNNSVFRSHVEQFLNTTYYNKGLSASEWLEDSAGNKYVQTNNLYDMRDVQDHVQFPALKQTEKIFFEGAITAGAGTVTQYDYDAIGNVTHVADAGDGSQQDLLLTDITYHDIDNLYIKSVPSSIVVTTAEGVKRKRTTTINPQGDIIRFQQFLADGSSAGTDIEYDNYGNMTKLTRPANYKNQRMWYSYDYDSAVHSYVTKVTDAMGYLSTSRYDYRFGVLTRHVNRNNEPTEYALDHHGRVVTMTGPYELAAGKPYTIAYDYHPEAVVPYAVTRHYDPEYDADINVINFSDGLGRSVQVKKQVSLFKGKGLPDEVRMVVSGRHSYDAFGRVARSFYPITEPKGPENFTYNTGLGNVASNARYDVEDRLSRTVLADGAVTQMVYATANGLRSKTVVDALNNRRETRIDDRDRRVFLALDGPDGVVSTRYDYDPLNELVKVVDNKGNALAAVYDNFGRKISVVHPDAGRTDLVYDLAGNMLEKITAQIKKEIPDGGAIKYQYDYERLTDIDYPRQYQNKVKYTYGPAGSGSKAGRIVLQEDASGGQEFFYSMQGQIVKTIRTVLTSPLFATTYVSSQESDSWNRIKKMTYPDGEEVNYHYNKGGGLFSMDGAKRGSTFNFVDQLGYDAYDQRVYMRYGNGTENVYRYDSLRRRLVGVQASSGGRSIMDNTITYDAVSNVVGVVNHVTAVSDKLGGYAKQGYHYDQLYRVDSASGEYNGSGGAAGYGVSLSYDNLNNILHKKMHGAGGSNGYDQVYSYNGAAPHQALQIGANKYTYDANGNQLGYGDVEHFYDEENRLMAVINKGVLSQYTYDAEDNRVVKSSGGIQGLWVNGAPAGAVHHDDNYTVYVSPFISCQKSAFVKHYFIDGQRIASQLGHGTFTNISFPQSGLTAGGVDYTQRASEMEQARNDYYASLGVSPGPPTDKIFWAKPENSGIAAPVYTDTTASNVPPGWPGNTTIPPNGPPVYVGSIPSNDSVKAGYGFQEAGHLYEGGVFYYHFDHVGSTSYVSNFQGEVSQHVEYTSDGESFIDEHAGSFVTPYLFEAKGLDAETGYYFYNPAFYDPMLSQWLSVPDPLGEGYPGDGGDGYSRVAGNDDEDDDDGNSSDGRIAYSGSEDVEKSWMDKKMNTKTKDRLSKDMARKLSNDPRVRTLANSKYGNRMENLRMLNGKALRPQANPLQNGGILFKPGPMVRQRSNFKTNRKPLVRNDGNVRKDMGGVRTRNRR